MGSDTAAIWDVIEHTILSVSPSASVGNIWEGFLNEPRHLSLTHADGVQEQREFAPIQPRSSNSQHPGEFINRN